MPGPGSVHKEGNFGLKEHWKVLAAMTLVSISTFQYGLDFGIIGSLQAMVGFLKVSNLVLYLVRTPASSAYTDSFARCSESRTLRRRWDTTPRP